MEHEFGHSSIFELHNIPQVIKKYLAFVLLLLSEACFSQEQGATNSAFSVALRQLLDNQRDSIPIASLGDIPAKQFNREGWEFFNQREGKELQNGNLSLNGFRPIVQEDIVEVREDLIVVLLHGPDQRKIHLASLKRNGDPIQSFLLSDRFGYLYEKNFRAYSFEEPYHYDERKKTFEFYQLIYGYEKIPIIESPTQDPIYHQSFHQLKINNQGLFDLVFSSDTGDILFNREKTTPLTHEVEFHELSILCVSNKNNPESALWQEEYMTHGDMESHDSITISLSYGAEWQERFFFLRPREGHQVLEVSQRHENIMVFPGDGTTCELGQWKRYQSPWLDLHCEDDFFITRSYSPEEFQRFPDYLPEELLAAFQSTCGNEKVPEENLGGLGIPSLDYSHIAAARIVIRIEYLSPSGKRIKYLILELANSC